MAKRHPSVTIVDDYTHEYELLSMDGRSSRGARQVVQDYGCICTGPRGFQAPLPGEVELEILVVCTISLDQ